MTRARLLLIWIAAVALLVNVAPTAAQLPQVCVQLEAQLATLDRGQSQAQYQQLLAQYQRERAAYDAALREAQATGCAVVFRRLAPPTCTATIANLDRLSANLSQLEAGLRAADPAQASVARTNLLRALGANNCGAQYAPYAGRTQLGILDRLFGPGLPGVPLVSTYRTLCVRGCDGFYFPISFSTTPAQFQADAAVCQAQCPGGDATLFVHLNPGEDVDAAVDLNGRRYSSLPNAFAYRDSYNPSCGCQPATIVATPATPAFSPIATTLEARLAALREVVPLPRSRPEPSEDPETLANRAGGLLPGPLRLDPDVVAGGVVGEGGIRLIGPAYYYAQ